MYTINNLFSIGEFSKIKSVPIDTLRYYDKIGLLKPTYVDQTSSYRYYSYPDLVKYDIIHFCRNVDMSLKEIASFFQESNPRSLTQFLDLRKEQLRQKIVKMNEALELLEEVTQNILDTQNIEKEAGFYLKNYPQRKIAYSCYAVPQTSENKWPTHTYIELVLDLKSQGIPLIYQGGFLHNLRHLQLTETSLFELLPHHAESYIERTLIFPKGQYLCVNFSEKQRDEALQRFLNTLKEQKLNPQHLLEFYLLSGSFEYIERQFELQCYIGE